MATGTPQVSVDDLVSVAEAERPSHFVHYVSTEDDEPNLIGVGMGESSGAAETTVFFTFDTRSTEVLDVWTQEEQSVMDVLWQLHYDMYAGLPGTLFLGFMGLLFVVSLVSGIVLYAPFMRKLTFGTVGHDRSLHAR